MIYFGIVPKSQLPGNIEIKEYHHSETHQGRTIKYYEVWVKDPNALPTPFPEDELKKEKVSLLDKIFNNKKRRF